MSVSIKPKKRTRILVPTDLSPASRGGIRFAIQWSRQHPVELVFVYVINMIKPPEWSNERFSAYAAGERARSLQLLERFVRSVFRTARVPQRHTACILLEGISADIALQDYCERDGRFDYVCMSTKGAGLVKRIFGTHTGNMITHSKVPVVAVPSGYRARPIMRVLYAGDMTHYERELPFVVRFAAPLKARMDMLHFMEDGEKVVNGELTGKMMGSQFGYPIRTHFKTLDTTLTFPRNLERQILVFRPSVAVLFTDQTRSVVGRILDRSRAERVSFALKVPLLVFPKS